MRGRTFRLLPHGNCADSNNAPQNGNDFCAVVTQLNTIYLCCSILIKYIPQTGVVPEVSKEGCKIFLCGECIHPILRKIDFTPILGCIAMNFHVFCNFYDYKRPLQKTRLYPLGRVQRTLCQILTGANSPSTPVLLPSQLACTLVHGVKAC